MLGPIAIMILNAFIGGPAVVSVLCTIDILVEFCALFYKFTD